MDTQALKTFLTLATYKNFTKTADALFVAQSTVTNRIIELEKEVGKQLFFRNKRSVTLTDEGETFVSYAKRIIELEDASIKDINSLNRYSNTLRIGTTNTIYECHLYPYIKAYMKAQPNHAVKVTIGHSDNLLRLLQDDLLDIIYSYLPFNKADYSCDRFTVDNLILVTNTNNAIYKDGVTKEDLVNSNYLYCNFALQEVGLFIKELFPPHFQFGFEIDNSTKLIPYLIDFNGISFLPESLARPYIEDGQLQEIKLLDFNSPKINCYRIYRKSFDVKKSLASHILI
jgi:LysR family transcriptional repressor of citA